MLRRAVALRSFCKDIQACSGKERWHGIGELGTIGAVTYYLRAMGQESEARILLCRHKVQVLY
jgi:hypothetical protein